MPLQDVPSLAADAAGLALVVFTSGTLTARSFAAKGGYRIHVDREFAAFGAANISSALSQGFAVTGADSRTAVGVAAGGRTQVTGLVAAATIAVVLLFLTEPLRYVPVAALGAVLIFAAFSLFDVGTLREIWKYDRLEVGLSLITMLGGGRRDQRDSDRCGLCARALRQTGRPTSRRGAGKGGGPAWLSFDRTARSCRENLSGAGAVPVQWAADILQRRLFQATGVGRCRSLRKRPALVRHRRDSISDIDVNGLYALRDLNTGAEARGATLMLAGRRTEFLIWLRRSAFSGRVGASTVPDLESGAQGLSPRKNAGRRGAFGSVGDLAASRQKSIAFDTLCSTHRCSAGAYAQPRGLRPRPARRKFFK